MSCNKSSLLETIGLHGGVVAYSSHESEYHKEGCPLCILEMKAACEVRLGLRKKITDDPVLLGTPDIRPINDAPWSSREVATPHLVRLLLAYEGWSQWETARKVEVTRRITIWTIQRIISKLPDLSDDLRMLCEGADDILAARRAAAAAAAEAAEAAAEAAEAAHDAAYANANAAAHATGYAARAAAEAAEAAHDADAAYDAAADAANAAAHAAKAAHAAADAANADKVLISSIDIWVEAATQP